MTKIRINLIIVFLFGFFVSHSQNDNILETLFDKHQLITVNKIIDFYDKFVIQQTENTIFIDKAYNDFLNKNCPIAIESGNLSLLLPPKNLKFDFYKTLDKDAFKEIFVICDSIKYFNRNKKEWTYLYQPYSFSLNIQGQYFQLLKVLSSRNDFFNSYFKSVETCGDLSPANYSAIMTEFKNIDFSKKEERLVLIINLLHGQDAIDIDELK